jgi:hypothetical protein
VGTFAAFFNNIANRRKFGGYRFHYQWDDPILVQDFKKWRYAGGVVGFLVWYFYLSQIKYVLTDYGMIPGNKRYGPF